MIVNQYIGPKGLYLGLQFPRPLRNCYEKSLNSQ